MKHQLRPTIATIALVAMIGGALAALSTAGTAQSNRQQVPLFEPDPLWSQVLPNKWVTGQVGGVAVDSHDNLWVFHRPDTIPDGEKAAALNPPQAECAFPRLLFCSSIPTEDFCRLGAARDKVTSGRGRSTVFL